MSIVCIFIIGKIQWFDFWRKKYATKWFVQNLVQCENAFTKQFSIKPQNAFKNANLKNQFACYLRYQCDYFNTFLQLVLFLEKILCGHVLCAESRAMLFCSYNA